MFFDNIDDFLFCMYLIKNKIIEKKTIKVEGEYKLKTVFNYSFEVLEEVIAS